LSAKHASDGTNLCPRQWTRTPSGRLAVCAAISKAIDSLKGAVSEFAEGRYDNCLALAYYACFQAAIAALRREGIRKQDVKKRWKHTFVHAQFAGQVVRRLKRYPSVLRPDLSELHELREQAQYDPDRVTQDEARGALRRAHTFVEAVRGKGGEEG
jgi:uncharacterized protein (UPF0332 family)